MAESSTKSQVIPADPATIMEVIADVEAYPEWTGAVKQVEITEAGERAGRPRRAKFTMDAGVIKDVYELEYDWADDDRSVSWNLVHGKMQKAQQGSYRLAEVADGTEVTYSLTVQLSVPLIGPLKRTAERTIIATALGELAKRVAGDS